MLSGDKTILMRVDKFLIAMIGWLSRTGYESYAPQNLVRNIRTAFFKPCQISREIIKFLTDKPSTNPVGISFARAPMPTMSLLFF